MVVVDAALAAIAVAAAVAATAGIAAAVAVAMVAAVAAAVADVDPSRAGNLHIFVQHSISAGSSRRSVLRFYFVKPSVAVL